MTTARSNAVDAVLAAERGAVFLDRVVDTRIRKARLDDREASLLRTLAYGSVRRRLTIDTVLAAYSRQRRAPRNRVLLEILRQAVFQILFLERIPARAAVHAAVELATASRGRKVAGFVNGLLRSILREISRVEPSSVGPATRRLRVSEGSTVEFGRNVFRDPAADSILHLAQVHSHPEWLVRRWVERFGVERCESLLRAGNEMPILSLRANRLRTDRDRLVERMRGEGIPAEPGAVASSVRVGEGRRVTELPGFADGHFTVEGEAAIEAASLVGAVAGERVLDVGAAPGGKSTLLAEAMDDRGLVVAVDRSPRRLRLVHANRERLGLEIVAPLCLDARNLPSTFEGRFDRVLLDAPCSNTGVLARRPDARWRIRPDDVVALATLQKTLLRAASRAVRTGGVLVYSTCSVEAEENRDVVEAILGEADWIRDEEVLRLPGDPYPDGGFASRWRRG